MTTASRKLPPIWLMGFTNATFGLFAGFSIVTLPQMLAAQGIPGGRIAAITATVLSPGSWVFLLAPMLDVRFSRRAYALVFAVIAAAAIAFTVLHHGSLETTEAVMLTGYIAASLVQAAVGGWLGSLIRREDDSRLGAWFSVSNLGSGGLMMLVAAQIVVKGTPAEAAALLGGLILLPSLIYVAVPAPPPDRRLARESFRMLFRDIVAVVKPRRVRIALLLFLLPSASFTLTNVLGGIGGDFHASERAVGLLAGAGAAVAGVAGSLVLPLLARRFALRPLYLGVGVAGGLFTLGLLLLPHAPWAFAVAITGENVFQALAFSAANAITFEVIGPGNPLAATLFALLIAATNLPIIYMGFIDGRAYTAGGFAGSIVADAGISIAVCALLAFVLAGVHRRTRRAA